MVGLQDSLYSVYSPHTQYQFVPDLGSVAVAVTSVPELSYQLQADTVTLTIPEAGPSCEELRLQVLAKTWTTELSAFLESELWTDTDIYCRGGQRLVAHRVMLAAASPLLSEVLTSALSSCDTCHHIQDVVIHSGEKKTKTQYRNMTFEHESKGGSSLL